MTPTETQIHDLLERRQAIDQTPDGSFVNNHRWLLDATEIILRCQLELIENLRDQGILR